MNLKKFNFRHFYNLGCCGAYTPCNDRKFLFSRLDIKLYYKFLFILLLNLTLTACVSTAISGASALYNHYELENNISDHYLAFKSSNRLYEDKNLRNNINVGVTVFHHDALLTGTAKDAHFRNEAVADIKAIPHINRVINAIELNNGLSSTQKLADQWITTKIESQLLFNRDINMANFKITTSNGIVYLMGIAPPDQARIATQIAASTQGVKKVVQLMQYIYLSNQLPNGK